MPAERPQVLIRKYAPGDREAVRRLCCETGFLGNPIDPAFEDRELFADYLTSYYTDAEPESSFVLEHEGEVKGYLLGSRFPLRQKWFNLRMGLSLAWRGLRRYSRYNPATKRFVRWIFREGRKEVPPAPKRMPHFHINLLAEVRNVPSTRDLVDRFLRYLSDCGETRVFGQMVVFEARRGTRMFERYGFRVINKSAITKYRHLRDEPVYLCTVIKDLERNSQLYGSDLAA